MLRFMLVEQVLHIMLNQDYPRFFCFFFDRKNIYFCITLYYRKWKIWGKSYANVCKAIFIQN